MKLQIIVLILMTLINVNCQLHFGNRFRNNELTSSSEETTYTFSEIEFEEKCESPSKCVYFADCNFERTVNARNTPSKSNCNELNYVCCPKELINIDYSPPSINELKTIVDNPASPNKPKMIDDSPPPTTSKTTRCGTRHSLTVGDAKLSANNDNYAEFGEFPWVLALMEQQTSQYLGVASLIHPQVAITAAHSILDKSQKDLAIKVRAGEWSMRTEEEFFGYKDRNVRQKIKHPGFDYLKLYNDFALLVLDEPFELAPHINTICLPSQDLFAASQNCISNGWGKDAVGTKGKFSEILKKIALPTFSHDQCQQKLRSSTLGSLFKLDQSFICAGGQIGVGNCEGDGGSPLSCPIPGQDDQLYLAGIASWGIHCKKQWPAAYANVAGVRNWIDEQMDTLGFEISEQKVEIVRF